MDIKICLSKIVSLPHVVDDRSARDGFNVGEESRCGYSEIFIRRAAESTQVMVFGRPNEVPVVEVARSVKHSSDIASGELSALNERRDGFQDIRGVEFERTRDVDAMAYSIVGGGERNETVVGGHSESVGVRVDGRL